MKIVLRTEFQFDASIYIYRINYVHAPKAKGVLLRVYLSVCVTPDQTKNDRDLKFGNTSLDRILKCLFSKLVIVEKITLKSDSPEKLSQDIYFRIFP